MRHLVLIVGLGLSLGTGIGIGCAAGETRRPGGSGGDGGDGGSSSVGPGSGGGSGGGFTTDGGGVDGSSACAKFSAEATQAPAAMLTVLDMSASMKKQQKWATAQTAIVGAIDKAVFDSMSLGLLTFPTSFTDPPQCVCDYVETQTGFPCQFAVPNGVSCGFSALPEEPLTPAGKDKSNALTGVRRNMYDYLKSHSPLSNDDDGSPVYEALASAYGALKAYPIDRRIAVLITDGGFSCTSLSNRPGYNDDYGCPDWEYPSVVNQLITQARTDPNKPIFTFVVGVPGSNSTGASVDGFATPPYNMRLALSTYAVSGSPDTVNPACDKGAMFSENGPEPAVPCHIDLSNGAAFDATALATAIADLRGKALGCVYDLPLPPPGETIDQSLVNVNLTIDGADILLKKRKNTGDQCLDEGCWDYNATGQVEVIGKGCADLGAAVQGKVEIIVGCETVLK